MTDDDAIHLAALEIMWQQFPGWEEMDYPKSLLERSTKEARTLLRDIGGVEKILDRTADDDRQDWIATLTDSVYDLYYNPVQPDHAIEECANLAGHIVNAVMTGTTRMYQFETAMGKATS